MGKSSGQLKGYLFFCGTFDVCIFNLLVILSWAEVKRMEGEGTCTLVFGSIRSTYVQGEGAFSAYFEGKGEVFLDWYTFDVYQHL